MNYDLGQILHVVNDSNGVWSGEVSSIQTTTYKSRDNRGKIKFSIFKQYHIDGHWYYSDRVFESKKSAVDFANEQIQKTINSLQNRISRG